MSKTFHDEMRLSHLVVNVLHTTLDQKTKQTETTPGGGGSFDQVAPCLSLALFSVLSLFLSSLVNIKRCMQSKFTLPLILSRACSPTPSRSLSSAFRSPRIFVFRSPLLVYFHFDIIRKMTSAGSRERSRERERGGGRERPKGEQETEERSKGVCDRQNAREISS